MDLRPSNSSADFAETGWSLLLAVWLVSILLFGGTPDTSSAVRYFFAISSTVMIALGLWRLRQGLPSREAVGAAIVVLISIGLLLSHLIPLPFDIWKQLPGREVFVRAFEAIETNPGWLAMSVSPEATKTAALSVLPPLAAFIGVLSLSRRSFSTLSAAVLACAFVGLIIGIIQKSQGVASGLYFYLDPGTEKYASGTFSNRNFFAVQLYTSVPFLAAFAMSLGQRWKLRASITFVFTLIYIGLLIAVLAAAGSRGGIVFAMISVLLTIWLVFRPEQSGGKQLGLGSGLVFALVGLVVMAQASMIGILRIANNDPLKDFRATMFEVSFEAAKAQFPFGSGFGTFVPVYQLYEKPEHIIDLYVSHAHNDWLELIIEGGFPAILIMAGFTIWLLYALFKAARLVPSDPGNAHIRAAGIVVVLLMAHSVFDFPFRTDAILTLFGLCVGLLALCSASPSRKQHEPVGRPAKNQSSRSHKAAPQNFRPGPRGFGRPAAASPAPEGEGAQFNVENK
jgi:O-antigen ligase